MCYCMGDFVEMWFVLVVSGNFCFVGGVFLCVDDMVVVCGVNVYLSVLELIVCDFEVSNEVMVDEYCVDVYKYDEMIELMMIVEFFGVFVE